MDKNYTITETKHPLTGDDMWMVEDIMLPLGGIEELVDSFIKSHPKKGYDLAIMDPSTGDNLQIDCTSADMPEIVDYVYHTEKGTPLKFIGVNSMAGSYAVGMRFSRGRLKKGLYKYENQQLNFLE